MKLFIKPSRNAFVFMFAAVILSFTACRQVDRQSSPLLTPSGSNPTSSPILTTTVLTTTSISVPTPSSDRAVIVGKLVSSDPNQKLVLTGNLYLGTLLKSTTSDAPPIVSLSRGDNPKAVIDPNTQSFVFTNVVSGTYALILDGISQSHVVQKSSGDFLLVVAVEGKVTNLGDVPIR